MKKLFVAVALVMGLGTSVAFAENFHASVDSVTIVNEYALRCSVRWFFISSCSRRNDGIPGNW